MLATDARLMADVELELVDRGDPHLDPFRFEGTVRHLTRSNAGHVRVGMEFSGLTDFEGRLLAMLFRRDAARDSRARAAVRVPGADRGTAVPVG